MKVKYQKVHNPSSLEMQFENQRKQFKKSQIPPERMDFYFIKLQSQNLLEIHYGLLGIKHTLYYNDLELDEIQKNNSNLMILLLNLVQKDLRPEITMRSLSILKDISQSEPLLFLRNYGVQTLLQAHLIRNSDYFMKIITILSNVCQKPEERERFKQVGLITLIIDFVKKSLDSDRQLKASLKMMEFINEQTGQLAFIQIRNFYEESLISKIPDLISSSLIVITYMLKYNTINELNPQLITRLFSMYKECYEDEQLDIINYFSTVLMQRCNNCNNQLVQFGFFDFLYEILNLKIFDILEGILLSIKCVHYSQERANIFANHQLFQLFLENVLKLQLFGYLIRLIELINFESLQNLINKGLLRVLAKCLKKLTKRIKENLNTIVPILQHIIDAGKANFVENYFLIEIKQLGIIDVLDSANVLIQLNQALYFDSNQRYILQE